MGNSKDTEFAFVLNKDEQGPKPIQLFTIENLQEGRTSCFGELEFNGTPRANFVDESMWHSTMFWCHHAPELTLERWFEYRDGLYFLKPDLAVEIEEPPTY